jgi:hypothetical protein
MYAAKLPGLLLLGKLAGLSLKSSVDLMQKFLSMTRARFKLGK